MNDSSKTMPPNDEIRPAQTSETQRVDIPTQGQDPQTGKKRIAGYDVARAMAILGMVIHHFAIVMARDPKSPVWLARLLEICDGRPAALFMILAGVGITLRSCRANEAIDPQQIAAEGTVLIKRGFVLLAFGFVNLLVWPGDILRVYGVGLILAAWMFNATNRRLIMTALLFVAGFGVLFCTVNYDTNWEWSTMTYHKLWSLEGQFRNLFYDGFRAVFPWCGFLFFGMWLGRMDLRNRDNNRRCLLIGLAVTMIAEICSAILVWQLSRRDLPNWSHETIHALFGTESMPPLPFFLAAAGGLAVAIIACCIRLADRFPQSMMIIALTATGQMALTWYFLHIYVGLGLIVILEQDGQHSLEASVVTGILFFTTIVSLSQLWKRRFSIGPLESIMRSLSQ